VAFWDGRRWRPVRPASQDRPEARHSLRDWLATALMLVVLGATALPLSQSSAAGASLSLSPSTAVVGARVAVVGRVLPPKVSLQLQLDGASSGLPKVRTSPTGRIKASFVVPTVVAGPHAVQVALVARPPGRSVSPSGVLASATLTVDASAPTPAATPIAPTPVATPRSTPAPTPRPGGSAFVSVCGTALCLGGRTWTLYGGAVFNGLDDPTATVAMAVNAHLNTVRVVNFLYEFDPISIAQYRERDWSRLDRFVAAAGAANLKVILDLSTFRNLLRYNGVEPYAYDWGPFLAYVASRINTVTGVAYRNDPTIAIISLAGEPEPISGNPDPLAARSSAELTDFYRRSYSQLRAHDPNHVISSGGLLQYGWDSGVDWRAIFGAVDICALHGYSDSDLAAVPTIAASCAAAGKPWITEEFGYLQSMGDAARADAYQRIYDLQRRYGSAGIGFWNLGPELKPDSHDVNATTPKTWAVVRASAP
jgi:hypothetical protein